VSCYSYLLVVLQLDTYRLRHKKVRRVFFNATKKNCAVSGRRRIHIKAAKIPHNSITTSVGSGISSV
jgi:hypothetical protein